MNLSQAQLTALVQANNQPAYSFQGQPVYRGVSTSGAAGGLGASQGPSINYSQLFSGVTGAIAQGAQDWAKAEAMKVPLMTIPDQDAVPQPPLATFQPQVPQFRSAPLSYLRPATA